MRNNALSTLTFELSWLDEANGSYIFFNVGLFNVNGLYRGFCTAAYTLYLIHTTRILYSCLYGNSMMSYESRVTSRNTPCVLLQIPFHFALPLGQKTPLTSKSAVSQVTLAVSQVIQQWVRWHIYTSLGNPLHPPLAGCENVTKATRDLILQSIIPQCVQTFSLVKMWHIF